MYKFPHARGDSKEKKHLRRAVLIESNYNKVHTLFYQVTSQNPKFSFGCWEMEGKEKGK